MTYSALYVFGASLSDAGNVYLRTGGRTPVSPPYFDGHFSNGPTWAEDLAAGLGIPNVTPSLAGGTDFAYGGATARGFGPTDLAAQFRQFEQAVPAPASDALYAVDIGSDDLLSYLANPVGSVDTLVNETIDATLRFIGALADDGAKNLLVLDVGNLGSTPNAIAQGPAFQQTASTLSLWYDWNLYNAVAPLAATEGLSLTFVDTYSLFNSVSADPAAFGFGNVTTPIWSGDTADAGSGAVDYAGGNALFWDGLHLSAAGHAFLGIAAQESLPQG